MTSPGDVGDVYAELHFRTDEAREDLKDALRDAGRDAENKEIGEDIGGAVTDGIDTSVRRSRPKMKKAMEEATADWEEIPKQRVRRIARYFRDKASGEIRIRYALEQVAEDAYDAVTSGGGGKNFNKTGNAIGTAIQDGIGAVFNVGGRSPLVYFLATALGFLAHAIASLLVALYPLGALLLTLPALLGSIAAQVGVVIIAFQGMGEAIGKAWNAKNAKELNDALKDLPWNAQMFVKQLLTAKQLLKDIQRLVQDAFFGGLGTNTISNLIAKLGPVLKSNLPGLAFAVGRFLGQLTDFFASPGFLSFINKVIPATERFLSAFGPGMVSFLSGLIDIAVALLPLLEHFGKGFSGVLDRIGKYFTDLSKSGRMDDFLNTAIELMDLSFQAIGALLEFLLVFIQTLATESGKELLVSFILFLKILTAFLQSGMGERFIKGLTTLIIILSGTFVGLLLIIGTIIGVIQYGIEAIAAFFEFLLTKGTELVFWLAGKYQEIKKWWEGFTKPIKEVKDAFIGFKNWITSFFSDAGGWLVQAGKNLVQGFIDGIRFKGQPLKSAVRIIIKEGVTDQMPGSPAKEGPLSGNGWSYFRGQAMVDDFARGMESQQDSLGRVSNHTMGSIFFGPGSVKVSMQGQVTPEQARITGNAVGMGAIDAIVQRDTALAVRSL